MAEAVSYSTSLMTDADLSAIATYLKGLPASRPASRTAPTPTRPSPLAMPSFAWKLSDQEVADVSTYMRNSWGNRANPVSASQVARMRNRLAPGLDRLTANSGDHF